MYNAVAKFVRLGTCLRFKSQFQLTGCLLNLLFFCPSLLVFFNLFIYDSIQLSLVYDITIKKCCD